MGGLVFYLYQTIDIIFDFSYHTIVFKHYKGLNYGKRN